MASLASSIRFEAGDVPSIHDSGSYSFFIVYADASSASSVVIGDDRWNEAEAFARCILDGIAQRRARKADTSVITPTSEHAEASLVGEQ